MRGQGEAPGGFPQPGDLRSQDPARPHAAPGCARCLTGRRWRPSCATATATAAGPACRRRFMLRIVICQYLHDLSDRQMEGQLRYNLCLHVLRRPWRPTRPARITRRCRASRAPRGCRPLRASCSTCWSRLLGRLGSWATACHAIDSRAVKANAATWSRIDRELASRGDDRSSAGGLGEVRGRRPLAAAPTGDARLG